MIAAISFFLGICAAWGLFLVPWQLGLVLLVLCGFIALRFPFLRLFCLFILGICYCSVRVALSLSAALPAGDHELVGVVSGIPYASGNRTVFEFAVDDGPVLRLSWYDTDVELVPGDRWRLLVRLRTMRYSRNEGGRDYEAYLLRSGILGTGYVRASAVNSLLGHEVTVDWVRYAVGSVFSGAPLLRALGIGDRSLMTTDHREVLAHTGTAHLVAISGLHIGMVAGLFGLLARWLWCLFPSYRYAAPRCAMVLGMVAALFYSLLAGFTLPTQRALLMICFYAGALWCGRNVAWDVLLSRALVCVLLFDPLAPAAADFWLSFGSVSVIMFVLSTRFGRDDDDSMSWFARLARFLFGSGWLSTQWAVCLGTLPLLLFWFGSYSLVSLPSNIIAIPVVSLLVLPLVLLGVGLSPWPLLAAVPLSLGAGIMEWLWYYLEYMASLPWAVLSMPHPGWLATLLCCLGVFLLLLPRGVVPVSGAACCLLALWLPASDDMAFGEARVVILDVGQGSAAVVMTRSHTMVVDTGAAREGGWSAARSVIVPFLQSRGRHSIDMLVLSHGDNDHSGGVHDLVKLMPVHEIVAGGGMSGFPVCQRGQSRVWDGVHFSFLHPPGSSWQGNDGSCVLRVAVAGKVVLLPGDIERDAELELLGAVPDMRADILVVPHHGSRTSSTMAFLHEVRPLYALVSAGCGNRFGFPKQDIMDRYRALGAVILSTATEGMIEVGIASDGGISHSTWRQREQRLWRAWECGSRD